MHRLPSSSTPWLFGLAAAVLAAFMLVFYVNLLRDAVARGSQFRYAQQTSDVRPVAAKAVATLADTRVSQR